MSRYNEIGKTATAHCEDDKSITVIYHATKVVEVDKVNSRITLNNGGYWTKTTMLRMNQASNYYCLGFSVYQRKGEWYVDYKGNTYPYNDRVFTIAINQVKVS